MDLSLGVDIGGTKVLGAVSDRSGNLIDRFEVATDRHEGEATVGEVVGELIDQRGHAVSSIGLAVAGFIEVESGSVAFAPNLPNLSPDIAGNLAARTNLPVAIENDANAAAWAEFRFGAGRDADSLVMVTVGTGIGGGAVLDGKLYRGNRGFAAEFGHMIGMVDGEECGCGKRGCLEAMASGTALAGLAKKRLADNPGSEVYSLAGGDPEAVTGQMVGEAAGRGDEFAAGLLAEIGRYLGLGLAGIAYAFDPEVIIVGGGVAEVGGPLLDPTVEALKGRFDARTPSPPLVPAELGNDAGVMGAAALAFLRQEELIG